jgi:hypothetical protein
MKNDGWRIFNINSPTFTMAMSTSGSFTWTAAMYNSSSTMTSLMVAMTTYNNGHTLLHPALRTINYFTPRANDLALAVKGQCATANMK